jgi:hypothetical protein
MELSVTTTYLEMTQPPTETTDGPAGFTVRKVDVVTPELNHFFFTRVGRPWKWYSRLDWSIDQW